MGLAVLASCTSFDYPDRFKPTKGLPAVHYVRYADRDIIIDQASMEETICIVGDNLTSVHDIYFNDQPAVLTKKGTLFLIKIWNHCVQILHFLMRKSNQNPRYCSLENMQYSVFRNLIQLEVANGEETFSRRSLQEHTLELYHQEKPQELFTTL